MAQEKPYYIRGTVVKNPEGHKVIVLDQHQPERPALDNLILQSNFEKQVVEELGLEEDTIVIIKITTCGKNSYGGTVFW